jgi:hypothetical protein
VLSLLDIDVRYKESFAALLWWMFKLRQRQTFKRMLDPLNVDEFTYIDWGRERLAELEYLMPVNFCRITIHLMQHVCGSLRLTGPVHATWMFVYERWVKFAKGFMHSAKGAGVGLMSSIMTHEWLIRNSTTTREQLNELLTPPLSNFTTHPKISLLGSFKPAKLETNIQTNRDRMNTFRLICNFLLSNDESMIIINNEFVSSHPVQSKNGSLVIYEWIISDVSFQNIRNEILNKFNKNVTDEEIKLMLAGPVVINEYKRIKINECTFVTDDHEAVVSRITRKYIYYRKQKENRKNKKNNKKHKVVEDDEDEYEKVVARIDKIYAVTTRSPGNCYKTYTLLKVMNYEFEEDHESSLPHVSQMTEGNNVFKAMPIISATDVLPLNIALWPTSLNRDNNFLVVHTDPFFSS